MVAFPHISPCSDQGGARDYDHKFELQKDNVGYFDALTYYTTPISLLGLPVVTMPIGHTPEGLPIGAQIVGSRNADEIFLRFAKTLAQLLAETG